MMATVLRTLIRPPKDKKLVHTIRAFAGSTQATCTAWPQVVLFGDSITQFSFGYDGFWGAALTDKLQRQVDVLNRGFSGYNTSNCRLVLPLLFDRHNVSKIMAFVIFLGANDASDLQRNAQQGLTVVQYQNNLHAMVCYLEDIGVSRNKLIFVTPPPVDPKWWQAYCTEVNDEKDYGKSELLTKTFAEACTNTAKDLKIDVVDVYTLMLKSPDWKQFLFDGLHLSHKGALFLADCIWPNLSERIKGCHVIGPDWTTFSPNDPFFKDAKKI